jgi:hypothetical protein
MTTWMVRSGPSEKWLQDFLGSNLVAAGWRELRDSNGRTLAGLTQSEIYEICEAKYPVKGAELSITKRLGLIPNRIFFPL